MMRHVAQALLPAASALLPTLVDFVGELRSPAPARVPARQAESLRHQL
jgi:hypothetical protein